MRADIKRRTDVKTNLMEREEPCYCCVESQTRPIPALAGTTQSKSKQDVIIINLLSARREIKIADHTRKPNQTQRNYKVI